jgi:enoyl-CoA hydratase
MNLDASPASATTSDDQPVVELRQGPVLVLRLNRPHRLNAVSLEMYQTLIDALSVAEQDEAIRAVVITGTGRGFCVGADLKAHGAGEATRSERERYVRLAQRANRRIQRSSLPVVAALNGHAVGAGLELALSSDLIVVAKEAKLRFPESALATFVGGGVTYTLPGRVGMARARELLLLADFLTPDDALAMGLVNEVCAGGEVLDRAMAMAHRLAERSPRSIRLIKRALDQARHRPPQVTLRSEARGLVDSMGTADWREGIRAFEERRAPVFVER